MTTSTADKNDPEKIVKEFVAASKAEVKSIKRLNKALKKNARAWKA